MTLPARTKPADRSLVAGLCDVEDAGTGLFLERGRPRAAPRSRRASSPIAASQVRERAAAIARRPSFAAPGGGVGHLKNGGGEDLRVGRAQAAGAAVADQRARTAGVDGDHWEPRSP